MTGLFDKSNDRSKKIVRNILTSFGIKAGSIAISLILVPMTINYVNATEYGIWLTISSLITWLSFFDVGMGNGMRNKLTSALALGEFAEAKRYVSTTYAVLLLISIGLSILLSLLTPLVNWIEFLNLPRSAGENIQIIIYLVICSFTVQFVVQLINTVLIACHKPAIAGLINFLGQLGVLVVIFILTKTVPGSLKLLVTTLTIVPVIVLVLASIYFYSTSLKNIRPSFGSIRWSYAKGILTIGAAFFFIQLGTLVLFQSSNIVITKIIGPTAVTEFNVVYKLFSVVIMFFSIIMTPYWSAFTDAYVKGEFTWMRKSIASMRKLWVGVSFSLVPALLFLSELIYDRWIGNSVKIDFGLTLTMAIYSVGYMCMNLNCYFLNGIGKVKVQMILYMIVCLVNIPLSFALGEIYGTAGVVLSNSIVIMLLNVILWIQINKILKGTASGFWNK